MVNAHRKMFFGQNVGMMLQSPSWHDPYIFLAFIRKKPDNSWEKPSSGEGKVLRFSLEEMVMILEVVRGESGSWSTVHKFKEEQTTIKFRWDKEDAEKLWVHINKEYNKSLDFAQIQIFRMLLDHVLQEKIVYGTSPRKVQAEDTEPEDKEMVSEGETKELVIQEEVVQKGSQLEKPQTKIKGIIKNQTEKAVLIEFRGSGEIWIPKSTIHSKYDVSKSTEQKFDIETWILEKNNGI